MPPSPCHVLLLLQRQVRVAAFDWFSPSDCPEVTSGGPFDVVLGGDLAYNAKL